MTGTEPWISDAFPATEATDQNEEQAADDEDDKAHVNRQYQVSDGAADTRMVRHAHAALFRIMMLETLRFTWKGKILDEEMRI